MLTTIFGEMEFDLINNINGTSMPITLLIPTLIKEYQNAPK